MARRPFQPDLMAHQPVLIPADRTGPLTVSQVAAVVQKMLAAHLPTSINVIGEVSNVSDRTHWFFSLKDEQATLRCVMFASSVRRVPFRLEDGQQVIASGRLDFYGAQGQLQFYVQKLEPVGQGALQLRFRQLSEELRQLGYFDPQRKQRLPLLPRRVAVVTSKSAAALQDVINTARQRWAGCQLLLFDVRVQGANAAGQIAEAIRTLSRDGNAFAIEAIILTRGGGSIEDLWAFNDREVADAIYHCPIPIAAAIGHETDTTIAELVADQRCATPTQAAMHVVQNAGDLADHTDHLARRLTTLVKNQLQQHRQRLDAIACQPIFRRPQATLQPLYDRLDGLLAKLQRSQQERLNSRRHRLHHHEMAVARIEPGARLQLAQQQAQAAWARFGLAPIRRLRQHRQQVEALERQLDLLGPMNVLRRGYSYTLGPDGRLLRSVGQVRATDRIKTMLVDGQLVSRVESAQLPDRRREDSDRAPAPAPSEGQLDLFADHLRRAQGAAGAGERRTDPGPPPGTVSRPAAF